MNIGFPTKHKCKFENCDREFIKFRSTDRFCNFHSTAIKLSKRQEASVKRAKRSEKGRKVGKTAIKKVSDKRAIQLREYSKLRKQFLKDNPNCAVYPYLKATEIHHKFSGANRNRFFLAVGTWMAVSREGHNFIHSNVSLSKERGYLK